MAGSLRGRYGVRIAESSADLAVAKALRARAFRGAQGGADGDAFDALASHVLVEETASGRVVCCYRLIEFASGARIGGSYSAQFYDLSRLAGFPGPMLELGRFCTAGGQTDADVLRAAWGALAAYVDAHRIEMIFGCASFRGTQTERYADAFALLRARHLAPKRWLPRVKAPQVFRFARTRHLRTPDLKAATRAMPPLLRSYLAMGGWVSDHAVIDADLDTLHVFTGLEIRRVPAGRARALRAAAG